MDQPDRDKVAKPARKEGVIPSPTTAVLVLLPGAEPLLDRIRRIAPVRPLPAHVSLLYPGPPPSAAEDVRRVDLPDEVELAEPMFEESGFLGVAAPALDPAAATLRARYPELVPYDGRFGVTPRAHLTLAMGVEQALFQPVRRILAEELPLRSRVEGPLFVRSTEEGWAPVSPGARP